jgi:hypothetical protein
MRERFRKGVLPLIVMLISLILSGCSNVQSVKHFPKPPADNEPIQTLDLYPIASEL